MEDHLGKIIEIMRLQFEKINKQFAEAPSPFTVLDKKFNEALEIAKREKEVNSLGDGDEAHGKATTKEVSFKPLIIKGDKDEVLRVLKEHITKDMRPSDIGSTLLQAHLDGYLSRVPNRAEFEGEFWKVRDKGAWEAIAKTTRKEDKKGKNVIRASSFSLFD